MELVYLVYGLSFVVIGVAILAQPREGSRFEIARLLWLFAAYALIHAPGDFISAWVALRTDLGFVLQWSNLFSFVAYGFLFEFGRRLLGLTGRTVPSWTLAALFAAVLGLSTLATDRFATLQALIGYGVRLPAGLLTGAGLFRYYRVNRADLEPLGVRKYFVTSAVTVLFWGFCCGVVRDWAPFFPANVLNAASFRAVTGVPVQVCRTLCGLAAAWSFGGMLGMFQWEAKLRERLDRAKDELLATVSHEMKTPLAAISLSLSRIEAVAAGQIPERAAQMVGNTRANILRLGRLVNDVLDLETVRSGKLGLHLQPVDSCELVKAAVADQRDVAAGAQVELAAEAVISGATVTCDRDHVERIFANLIANAIQFSSPGSTVTVRAADGPGRQVRFSVIDRGPSIPPDQVPVLFHRFQRFTPPNGHERGGSGLSLAVARALVEAHGGVIGVDSRDGEGTTFYFDLPRLETTG